MEARANGLSLGHITASEGNIYEYFGRGEAIMNEVYKKALREQLWETEN